MKHLIVILTLATLVTISRAQTRLDIGVVAIPSLSKFNTECKYEYKYLAPFNFGLKTNITYKKFIFSTGMLYFKQGTRFTVDKSDPNNPELVTGTFDVFIRVKAIVIPLNVDYIFLTKNKTELTTGIGLYVGHIYSQQQENTSIPENYQPPSNIIYLYPPERFTNMSLFDGIYFGGNIGLSIRHNINNNWNYNKCCSCIILNS